MKIFFTVDSLNHLPKGTQELGSLIPVCSTTRLSQKFYNILVIWGTIQQYRMLLLRL